MHFLIDGYNLLFRLSPFLEEFSASREAIIKELSLRATLLKWHLTVVFDAPDRQGVSKRTHYHNLEILYSGEGETADELIIKVLKRLGECGNCTVVTSDKRLAWKARHLGAKTESVESFVARLNKRYLKPPREAKKRVVASKTEDSDYLSLFEKEQERTKESSSDEYLSLFEKELLEQKPAKQKSKKSIESDFERWFRIFEERVRRHGA
jgi:uncharacterized protein